MNATLSQRTVFEQLTDSEVEYNRRTDPIWAAEQHQALGDRFNGTLPLGVKAHYLESDQNGDLPRGGEKVRILRALFKEHGSVRLTHPAAQLAAQMDPVGYAAMLLASAAGLK